MFNIGTCGIGCSVKFKKIKHTGGVVMFGTFKVEVRVFSYDINASDIDDSDVVDPFEDVYLTDEEIWERKEQEVENIQNGLPDSWDFTFDCEEEEIEEYARQEIEDSCGYAPGSIDIDYELIEER